MVAVSSGVMTFAADTTSGSGSSTAAASSTTVQVTYNANRGTFKSGFNNKVSAAPGTHITLPGADAATLTGNQASHLAGWSTSSTTSVPEYKPGDDYVVPSSGVTLYAPQQYQEAAAMTGKALDGKAMLSIVAGVTTDRLQAGIDGTPRILRLLPNTPALVYEGAFALNKGNDFTSEEEAFSEKLFASIGTVLWVKESDLDAVCGLSGGGPAYVAMFIEALADGGVKEGLTRDVAYKLAAQTVLGSAKMILETGMHPGQLKDMVTSPAGTTIEGCDALEEGGFRHAVIDCVVKASERSRSL